MIQLNVYKSFFIFVFFSSCVHKFRAIKKNVMLKWKEQQEKKVVFVERNLNDGACCVAQL